MGAGIVWVGLSRDVDVLTLAGGSHLVINKVRENCETHGLDTYETNLAISSVESVFSYLPNLCL